MSIDCKELCEGISKAYQHFLKGTLRDEKDLQDLTVRVDKIVQEFTADSNLEIERKAKRKSDAMYEAVKLIETALGEIGAIKIGRSPDYLQSKIEEARTTLLTSM